MPKNLIVCADGTGNQGGSTPSSNVYKIYKAIDKHYVGKEDDGKLDEQIVFYDNGVGTEKNKLIRIIGGAFGFGFKDNVCDLYKFLARNYEKGDKIFFFGFSRGASTVRACNGFISSCGLVRGRGLRNREFKILVEEAFDAYKVRLKEPEKGEKIRNSDSSNGVVDIHMMGIWDTVVALGFPKRTDVTGPVSAILKFFFCLAEKALDKIMPHSFYNYNLTDNVKHAYQALAIDDERTAFWPFVLQEKGRKDDSVEQVWFAGMHSNVGGGYGRSGTASIPLHWMILRAVERGLEFNHDAVQQAFENSHVYGRIHNSRDGFAVMYRYHPRVIELLCDGRLNGNIRLHSSVIDRIKSRTANYSPGQLPTKFEVVDSDRKVPPVIWNPGKNPKWAELRAEIDTWVLRRKGLYAVMLTFVITFLVTAFRLRDYHEAEGCTVFWSYLAGFFGYLLPDFFDGLITFVVAQHYMVFVFTIILVSLYVWARRWCYNKTVDACERLRHLIIHYQNDNNG